MCKQVCACACVCASVLMGLMCVYACMGTSVHVCVCVCVCGCAREGSCMRIFVRSTACCMLSPQHMFMHIYTWSNIHTHTHACTNYHSIHTCNTRTHTCTHTHTYPCNMCLQQSFPAVHKSALTTSIRLCIILHQAQRYRMCSCVPV